MKREAKSLICEHPHSAGCDPYELRRVPFPVLSKLHAEVWVAFCGKPPRYKYYQYISRCESCLRLFSSPWEALCVPCFRAENQPGTAYRGWRWVWRNINLPLDERLDLAHTDFLGTSSDQGDKS